MNRTKRLIKLLPMLAYYNPNAILHGAFRHMIQPSHHNDPSYKYRGKFYEYLAYYPWYLLIYYRFLRIVTAWLKLGPSFIERHAELSRTIYNLTLPLHRFPQSYALLHVFNEHLSYDIARAAEKQDLLITLLVNSKQ